MQSQLLNGVGVNWRWILMIYGTQGMFAVIDYMKTYCYKKFCGRFIEKRASI